MTKPPQPELFAERPVRSDFARRAPSYALRRIITVLVLLGVIGGGLYIGLRHASPTQPGQIPTVKADGNYKQRPAQPGGIDIPHQDVQVYQQLDNNAPDKPAVEHLLPPPEVPQAVPVSPNAQNPAPPPAATNNLAHTPALVPVAPPVKTQSLDSIMTPDRAPAPPVNTTVATAPAPVVPPLPVPAPAAIPKPATKTIDQVLQDVAASTPPATAAPAPVPDQTVNTGPAVQLASTPDQAAAQTMARNLQSKYASILGPAKLRVVKADLGEKGIYYRVQSQSLSDDKAIAICSAVKDLNAGCILVRR
jgi:hypothetical protein